MILIVMPDTAEEISQRPEVRKKLQRATGGKYQQKIKARGGTNFGLLPPVYFYWLRCRLLFARVKGNSTVGGSREAGRVKMRLIKKLLAGLNTAPEKMMFPRGANR